MLGRERPEIKIKIGSCYCCELTYEVLAFREGDSSSAGIEWGEVNATMIVHGICKGVCSDMALAEKTRLVPPAHGPICLTIHELTH